jgi:hypothetical protein
MSSGPSAENANRGRLVELHRGDADIHRHAVDAATPASASAQPSPRNAAVEHEARGGLACLGPPAAGRDRVRIAVKGMDGAPASRMARV